jgi:hypothetical protein
MTRCIICLQDSELPASPMLLAHQSESGPTIHARLETSACDPGDLSETPCHTNRHLGLLCGWDLAQIEHREAGQSTATGQVSRPSLDRPSCCNSMNRMLHHDAVAKLASLLRFANRRTITHSPGHKHPQAAVTVGNSKDLLDRYPPSLLSRSELPCTTGKTTSAVSMAYYK